MSDVITHPLLSLILDQQWADEMTLEEIQSEHLSLIHISEPTRPY